jgi:hypothetical protein
MAQWPPPTDEAAVDYLLALMLGQPEDEDIPETWDNPPEWLDAILSVLVARRSPGWCGLGEDNPRGATK